MRKHLTYANVVASLALIVAIGTGGAYAASKITSAEIKNNTIRSVDLKNRKAVRGIDVQPNSLTGKEIREQSLDISTLVAVAGSEPAGCDPSGASYVSCAEATIDLKNRARLLAIATGGQESNGGPAQAVCQVRVDGAPSPLSAAPGEAATDNTSLSATNGFARTVVTPPLAAGPHTVSLACSQLAGDVRIENPTLAVLAVRG